MARTISWRDRVPELCQQVTNSVIETWTRKDLERVFDLKRASAQLLMKAIGDVQSIGGTHMVSRNAILSFLETLYTSNDPESARRELILLAEPVPKPRLLKTTVPEDLRSVMAKDLPPQIMLSPGRLEICGVDGAEILKRLVLLAQAMQNDLRTITEMLDPPPAPVQVEDDELKALFDDLRRREEAWKASKQLVGAGD
jgi:hypothetical protein